jgi:uncharacterized protein
MPVQAQLVRIVRDTKEGHPLVVLREVDGHRQLPILIGMYEAISVHRALHGFRSPRPATHDLVMALIEALDGQPESVAITALVGHTYHACINITRGQERFRIDARPSDAIAIAHLADPVLPIYVDERLFATAEQVITPASASQERPPHIEQDVSCGASSAALHINEAEQNPHFSGRYAGQGRSSSDAAIHVRREFAFGVFFPPCHIDPRLAGQSNCLASRGTGTSGGRG